MPLFCSRDSIDTEDLKTHVPVAPFLSYSSEKTLDFIYQGPKWRQPFSQWRVALKEESETRAEIFFVFMPRPFSFQGFQRRRVGKCRRDVSGCTRAQTHTENDETGPHTCPRTHTNWALWSKQYDCNTHTHKIALLIWGPRVSLVNSRLATPADCSFYSSPIRERAARLARIALFLPLYLFVARSRTHKHTLLQAMLFPVIRQHKHVWGNTGRLYELTINLIPKEDLKQTGTFKVFFQKARHTLISIIWWMMGQIIWF